MCGSEEDFFAACYFLQGPVSYSSSDVLCIVHNMTCWYEADPEAASHTFITAEDVAVCIPVSASQIYFFPFLDAEICFYNIWTLLIIAKSTGSQEQHLKNPGEPCMFIVQPPK